MIKKALKKHRKNSARSPKELVGTHSYSGTDASVYDALDPELTTEFVGYDNMEAESEVTALTSEEEIVDALSDGEKGTVIVAKTPLYATSGGQEADKGVIRSADGEFVVEDVVKLLGGKFGHVGHVIKRHDQNR